MRSLVLDIWLEIHVSSAYGWQKCQNEMKGKQVKLITVNQKNLTLSPFYLLSY
jgi:hypothetical protein